VARLGRSDELSRAESRGETQAWDERAFGPLILRLIGGRRQPAARNPSRFGVGSVTARERFGGFTHGE